MAEPKAGIIRLTKRQELGSRATWDYNEQLCPGALIDTEMTATCCRYQRKNQKRWESRPVRYSKRFGGNGRCPSMPEKCFLHPDKQVISRSHEPGDLWTAPKRNGSELILRFRYPL